jgi:hypothetical protein
VRRQTSEADRFARGLEDAEVADERLESHPVPGGGDHSVCLDPHAAREHDAAPVEGLDRGHDLDQAGLEGGDEAAIDDRPQTLDAELGADPVGGLRHSVPTQAAPGISLDT